MNRRIVDIGWTGILRLGLVQAALGSIVVVTTSTLNRVMVVELMLPALLPGALVALHYVIQVSRPRFGHGSDAGARRTPWIIGGMCTLACGGVLAAASTALMSVHTGWGIVLAFVSFILIGAGVGASGTCLLVLLAASVAPEKRAPAASLTWIMMIAGFAVTAATAGAFLDPFSFARLIAVSSVVSAVALVLTVLALWNLEPRAAEGRVRTAAATRTATGAATNSFRAALAEVLAERHTRRFALFIFVSMLAFSAQDLILEPFAGAIFGLTPGESTRLGGVQHGGVLVGMILVALIGRLAHGRRSDVLRLFMIGGCVGSSLLLAALAYAGTTPVNWPLLANVFALGVANGAFAVAAIGFMMGLVAKGHANRDGVRMGIWGAAQAVAFGLGGIIGTLSVDVVRWLTGSVVHAYGSVFLGEAILFAFAATLALRIVRRQRSIAIDTWQGLGAQ